MPTTTAENARTALAFPEETAAAFRTSELGYVYIFDGSSITEPDTDADFDALPMYELSFEDTLYTLTNAVCQCAEDEYEEDCVICGPKPCYVRYPYTHICLFKIL